MFLLKEKTVPRKLGREEIGKLKALYGIRRGPEYFFSLLHAVRELGLSAEEKEDLGLIYVSHLGPVHQVRKYVDDLLSFPPEECSPALFSHSVFNAPTAFLTQHLSLHGPSLCLCGFRDLVEASVLSAYAWLETSCCARVLLLCSDEESEISSKITELTGLKLFPSTHLLLLGEKGADEKSLPASPRLLIEKINRQIREEK
ncbi:MAG: beta-ketoacyl synthase chain length factor [Lentisphaeria bacterium]|nr:beta-ketoacyl synthase chain length factor [Lentisphaeria bacterium]